MPIVPVENGQYTSTVDAIQGVSYPLSTTPPDSGVIMTTPQWSMTEFVVEDRSSPGPQRVVRTSLASLGIPVATTMSAVGKYLRGSTTYLDYASPLSVGADLVVWMTGTIQTNGPGLTFYLLHINQSTLAVELVETKQILGGPAGAPTGLAEAGAGVFWRFSLTEGLHIFIQTHTFNPMWHYRCDVTHGGFANWERLADVSHPNGWQYTPVNSNPSFIVKNDPNSTTSSSQNHLPDLWGSYWGPGILLRRGTYTSGDPARGAREATSILDFDYDMPSARPLTVVLPSWIGEVPDGGLKITLQLTALTPANQNLYLAPAIVRWYADADFSQEAYGLVDTPTRDAATATYDISRAVRVDDIAPAPVQTPIQQFIRGVWPDELNPGNWIVVCGRTYANADGVSLTYHLYAIADPFGAPTVLEEEQVLLSDENQYEVTNYLSQRWGWYTSDLRETSTLFPITTYREYGAPDADGNRELTGYTAYSRWMPATTVISGNLELTRRNFGRQKDF